MKIIELRAENFKRLKAVAIKPDGTLQQITGRNAQGKTSVLDAVWAALAGKDASPSRPIRDGEKRAEVSVDLGDLRVIRRWTADDKTTLVVESKDGARHPSPQAMLDKLVGSLTFDPLAFVRSPPKEQAATLRKIAGVDTSALELKRRGLYEQRTEANRALKAEQAKLDAIPIVDAPDELITFAGLSTMMEEARNAVRWNEGKRKELVAYSTRLGERARKIEELQAQQAADEAERVKRSAEVEMLVDPDLEQVKQQIADAEATNAKIRQKQSRAEHLVAVSKASEAAKALDKSIERIDEAKAKMLESAKFPVPGLSVDGDTPTFNSIPLAQSSSAEQIRVGLAVAAALNPTLRVVLVRDGSLLDGDGLRMVAEWAAEHDMQVLCERVAGDSPIGIVIEDGSVVGVQDDEVAA